MIVTATFAFGDTTITFDVSDYTYPTEGLELGTTEVTISYTFMYVTKTATQEMGTFDIEEDLDNNSWETISWVARHGLGSTYWNIGDRKAITLEGPIGPYLTLVHTTLYVYILDFNHPENGVPDNNIIFGGFFTAKTGGKDVCLVDSKYGTITQQGWSSYLRFSMNHYPFRLVSEENGGTYHREPQNVGGWKGCDLRYDILGSTKSAPSGYSMYNRIPENRTGYDATQAAIDSPAASTLMSAIPSDFRNVLRLRTHYMDNKGGKQNYDGTGKYVTSVTDSISFLSEYEVMGTYRYSSPSEMTKQSQMAYYANGGSKVKYKHNSQNTEATWWLASPYFGTYTVNEAQFCAIGTDGTVKTMDADDSFGLAPVFKV
jgi:hypothetical protein